LVTRILADRPIKDLTVVVEKASKDRAEEIMDPLRAAGAAVELL
jgi:ribosomal protein L7/L12